MKVGGTFPRLDERNEQPLHAAIVAVVVVWATALLLALV